MPGAQDRAKPRLNLTTCKVLMFMEGGKPENPEHYNSTSHEFDEDQHEAIPRWSPIQLLTRPTGLNFGARW